MFSHKFYLLTYVRPSANHGYLVEEGGFCRREFCRRVNSIVSMSRLAESEHCLVERIGLYVQLGSFISCLLIFMLPEGTCFADVTRDAQ